MTNINLLPPEIAQKRALELRRLYIGMAGALVVGVIVLIYLGLGFQVSRANNELEALKQKSQRLTAAKTQLQQFADRKAELQKKQKIAQQVVANEVQWAKVLNEISMISPAECWLESIKASESEGFTFTGHAVDATQTASSGSKETTATDAEGHKPVAKWLVRLSLIKDLTEIWLTDSSEEAVENSRAVKFVSTASWKTSHALSSPSAAPAPPAANPSSTQSSGGG